MIEAYNIAPAIRREQLDAHVPAAINIHAKIELVHAVFSVRSASFHIHILCKEKD
jgi:hypothetical protein